MRFANIGDALVFEPARSIRASKVLGLTPRTPVSILDKDFKRQIPSDNCSCVKPAFKRASLITKPALRKLIIVSSF